MESLRPYRPGDGTRLLALFRDTIRRVNRRDYSADQVGAWASEETDPVAWSERFPGRFVVVAEQDQRPVGFVELEADGRIDRFYVSADHQQQGIGHRLLEALVAEARRRGVRRMFVEASITARPFFERHGFAVLAQQTVTCRGVGLANCRMERWLEQPEQAGEAEAAEAARR